MLQETSLISKVQSQCCRAAAKPDGKIPGLMSTPAGVFVLESVLVEDTKVGSDFSREENVPLFMDQSETIHACSTKSFVSNARNCSQ